VIHIESSSRYRNLHTSKVSPESQAPGTSLFTSAASSNSNQRGCSENSSLDIQVRCPEGKTP